MQQVSHGENATEKWQDDTLPTWVTTTENVYSLWQGYLTDIMFHNESCIACWNDLQWFC